MNQRQPNFIIRFMMVCVIGVTCIGVASMVGGKYPPIPYQDSCQENTIVEDMWRYESSPSDRRAILEGLSAMQCIDAGLCELAIDLPTAGSHNEP